MKTFHSDESSESPLYDVDDEDPKRHCLFTKEDDEKLKSIIEKYYQNDLRKINWSFVSFQMSNKNKRQCKDRYVNYLRDGINCDKFSPEENYLLRCKVDEIGHKWRMISKFFVNRTDIIIKAQYRKLMRRHATKENVMFIDAEYLRRSRNKRKQSHVKLENHKKSNININPTKIEVNEENLLGITSLDKCFLDTNFEDFMIFEEFIN